MRSFGIEVVSVDVFRRDDNKKLEWWLATYFWLLKFAPGLWRFLYDRWSAVPGIRFVRNHVLPRRFKSTQSVLLSAAPDLVLSTHPVATAIADFLKRRRTLRSCLWVAFSDWHLQPFWMFPSVDQYLVPIDWQRDELEKSGTPRNKVTVVGMLLDTKYYERMTKEAARAELNLKTDTTVILAIGGGKGWALELVIDAIKDTQATCIIVGGSEGRRQELERYIARQRYLGDWHILGWVDTLKYLIAADVVIAKPGGLTTAEALHLRKPLILCGAMPGHEEENGQVLRQLGVAWAFKMDHLRLLVKEAIHESSRMQPKRPLVARHLLSRDTPTLVLKELSYLRTHDHLEIECGN